MPESSPHPTAYILPSSPALLVDDRLSILENDEPEVAFWKIFTALLQENITRAKSLVDLFETISVTLRGSSGTNYGFLRSFLEREATTDFWNRTWPVLKSLALRMPALFPGHSLPILSASHTKIVLSREQVACLVVHQFLCTLSRRTWDEDVGYQDFHVWYDDHQPHSGAVEAYLKALFAYFNRLASQNGANTLCFGEEEWPVIYEMTTDDTDYNGYGAMKALKVLRLPQASTSPTVLGLPYGAAVISANKFVGFGRTGTQEETHVGASPEACPAVLVTPPLTDDQVMIVTGPEAMVSIEGYGREAYCAEILKPSNYCSKQRDTWKNRTMLFMDAMELDLADRGLGVPVDLQSGNVSRELRKAYIAFRHKRQAGLPGERPSIFTGFWGCRTFGGNPDVKACIQWVAASLADCDLTFICSGPEQHLFADKLEKFVSRMQAINVGSAQFKDVLLHLRPGDVKPEDDLLESILSRLKKQKI